MNDPRGQAIFRRPRHNTLSAFILSQDYYDLPKRTIRANGKICHIFKPNTFSDVQNLYRDKASMDMTLSELTFLNNTCWDQKFQPDN